MEYIRLKQSLQVSKDALYQPMILPQDNTYVLVQPRGSYTLQPALFKGLLRGVPQFISPHSGVSYDILGWMPMPVVANHKDLTQEMEVKDVPG